MYICYVNLSNFVFLLEQIEGFKMNLIYYDLYQATRLEKFVTGMFWSVYYIDKLLKHIFICLCSFAFAAYGQFLKASGEQPVTWKRAASMEEVLREADVVIIFYMKSAFLDLYSPIWT